jgi:hypothetical protein
LTTNEIRFYLHGYDNLKREIKNLREALEEYRKMDISGIRATAITDEPRAHNNMSRTEQMAITRLEYIKGLENELDSKTRLLTAINSVYFYLKEPARTIIEMRYFITPMINDVRRPKYSWFEISCEVDKSEDYCKEIDCKVISKIQEKLIKGEMV